MPFRLLLVDQEQHPNWGWDTFGELRVVPLSVWRRKTLWTEFTLLPGSPSNKADGDNR